MLIKPIKTGNFIIKLEHETIMSCQNKIFEITNPCKNYDELNLCQKESIKEITSTNCIPNLLKSSPSTCKKSNNFDIPSLEIIQDGLLLFNQYNGSILVNGNHVDMHGTFVVQYQNATITVGNVTLSHYEKETYRPLPAILSSLNSNHYFEETLSLQLIKQLHLNNSKTIQLIDRKNTINSWESSCALLICVVIIIIVALKCAANRRYELKSTQTGISPIYSEIQKKANTLECNGLESGQSIFPANGDDCI